MAHKKGGLTLGPASGEMTSLALQVFLFAVATLAVGRVESQSRSAKVEDERPKQIFGYPVDRGYSVQERGPQEFAPVTEEPSREQQYFRDSSTPTQQQRQQQPSLFTPEQQQAFLQQHYQNYAQLLNQQQQYLSSSQQQQLYQHQQLQQQQLQQPQLRLQQLQKQTPLQQQPLQQQRQQQSDSVASTISLLGVRYSAAPSVAHTMFRTNTGVSFSY